VIVTGIIIVSGCGASFKSNMVRPSVSPAAIVQVNQQLEIPNRKARVYIQDGAVTPLGKRLDKWGTYCSVRMQRKHASGEPKLSVLPGQFKITKVIESEDNTGSQRTYVASLGWFIDAKDDPYVNVVFGVEMHLSSADQPGVRSLICEKRSDKRGLYNYPTLEEIRIALGNTIEIKTP
jgi:hypothetical protein